MIEEIKERIIEMINRPSKITFKHKLLMAPIALVIFAIQFVIFQYLLGFMLAVVALAGWGMWLITRFVFFSKEMDEILPELTVWVFILLFGSFIWIYRYVKFGYVAPFLDMD